MINNSKENAKVEKLNGEVCGPYQSMFMGKTIFILEATADVEEGDTVLRVLPSGRIERFTVTEATFCKTGMSGMGSHFQLKFRKGTKSESKEVNQTIHIAENSNVQIGNNNNQQIISSLENLLKQIDSADNPPQEKEEAKNLLGKFLEHPATVAIVGPIAQVLMKANSDSL